ncbi:alpha/beta fold hydrolase [Lentilactobacillus hilgardii]|uniref:Alpha/beta fold hydrolase n=2 Tax=Lentilactobacillus hilgardii TaxID=1588 RepID=A0A6P1E5N7_LENHI|nr:alpha/beta hydrolase [Lentilactobacillus hilgardii]EEI70017.1 hypothetical protein HMPREF0496_2461 [Lentilactobacillus hilgardii ATCC 27305]MCT3391872.1 alpha/beta hydrolase [Lentilactobacillus hilgardii]QHB52028.1 alpha/beta fold hydrolase [Lentilactobacillus hilgardii]RRG11438.1 MAG: alpha/beta hydrolase [Lactobacillus sp.]
MSKEYRIPTNNHTELAVTVFSTTHPVGIVQVIHGALEHQSRYFDFAAYLNQQGFIVLTSDNRGHGRSVSKDDPLGIMFSWQQLVNDQVCLSHFIKRQYPGLPLFLFGHSFGSILGRLYLQKHDQLLNGLILTGTANYIPMVSIGLLLGTVYTRLHLENRYSKLLSRLSGLTPGDHSWLSYNLENVQRVSNDPDMINQYPVLSLMTLWQGDYELKQVTHFHCQRPGLPIISITGDHDKFSGGSHGLTDTIKTLHKIGYSNVKNKVMPHMKHEVLQEVDHQKVYEQIDAFLYEHI